MRRTYTLLATLALITLCGGCTSERAGSPANAGSSTNSAGASSGVGANGNGSAGSREGVGPNDTGIGGATNANSAVKGNSNVEPTGVNKNVGQSGGAANAKRP